MSYAEAFAHMATLRDGWDSYNAPAPSSLAIAAARAYVELATAIDFAPDRVAPSVVGGVGVTHRDDEKVYVEFYNDGTVLALFSDHATEPTIRRVKVHGFRALIAEAKEWLRRDVDVP